MKQSHISRPVVHLTQGLQINEALVAEVGVALLEDQFEDHQINVQPQKDLEGQGEHATAECFVRVAALVEVQVYDVTEHVVVLNLVTKLLANLLHL